MNGTEQHSIVKFMDKVTGRGTASFPKRRILLGILPLIAIILIYGYVHLFEYDQEDVDVTSNTGSIFDIPDAKNQEISSDKDIASLKVIPSDTGIIPLLDVSTEASNGELDSINLQLEGEENIRKAFQEIDMNYQRAVVQEPTSSSNPRRHKKLSYPASEDSIIIAAGLGDNPPAIPVETVHQSTSDQRSAPHKSTAGTLFQPVSENSKNNTHNIAGNQIDAVVIGDYRISSGSRISIRTLQECFVANVLIPRNTVMPGIATLNGNRLAITIPGQKINAALRSITFTAYDTEGIEGIEVEGIIKQEIKENTANETIDEVTGTVDNRVVGAIVKTVKTIANKKQGVPLTIPAGTKIKLQYAGE